MRLVHLILALVAMAAPAMAVPVTQTVTFSGSDFGFFIGDPAAVPPVDTVSGSFKISFDTTPAGPTPFDAQFTDLVVESFSINFGAETFELPALHNFSTIAVTTNAMFAFDVATVFAAQTFFDIEYVVTQGKIARIDYALDQGGDFNGFIAGTKTFDVVPLPTTAPLLGSGLLGLAWLGRHIRRARTTVPPSQPA